MRKTYQTLSMEVLQVDCGQTILAGSLTKKTKIDVNNVAVKDFENGFASETNGFKDLDFD